MEEEKILNEVISLLGERLEQHNTNKKEVQDRLQEVRRKTLESADAFEEKLSEELRKLYESKEKRLTDLIENLNNGGVVTDTLIKQANSELTCEYKFDIIRIKKIGRFCELYTTNIRKVKISSAPKITTEDKVEVIIDLLKEHLNKRHDSLIAAQDKLTKICTARRNAADEMVERVNADLNQHFEQEDTRLQSAVKSAGERLGCGDPEAMRAAAKLGKMALVRCQRYTLDAIGEDKPLRKFGLVVAREVVLKYIDFEKRQPFNTAVTFTNKGEFSLSFDLFGDDEVEVLKVTDVPFRVAMELWEKDRSEDKTTVKKFTKEFALGERQIVASGTLSANMTYCSRIRVEHGDLYTLWSDEFEFSTQGFKELCMWKRCPSIIDKERSYTVGGENQRIATNVGNGYNTTVIGNTPIPLNMVTSWNVKILKSKNNDGCDIHIGVIPADVDQNIYHRKGWFVSCYRQSMWADSSRKEGEYVHTGDSVGIIMDTVKGELSFAVNGVSFGLVCKGIPLDKPLVPCVILFINGDSVELDTSEVKDNVDGSVPVPPNITPKSDSWDSIILTWDKVSGASFYQIEIDGGKSVPAKSFPFVNAFAVTAYQDHNFRVRAVKGSSVSEWSDVVTGRTQKAPVFKECCVWKKCPGDVDDNRKYSVDGRNPRVATMIGTSSCTIIGDTPIPSNTVTSWSVEILKSKKNNGGYLYIGVAPSDINQNKENYNGCGWYFDCGESELLSGPPHKYYYKKYGPRKEKGQYVHNGDSVGVVMDTERGDLSFVLGGVNLGVAYEGIPLDKPLVPCVLLNLGGDSVRLIV